MYGEGISKTGELLDMAVEKDLVNKSGAWYSYGNERIGQGRENAKQWFADHEDAMNELMNKVRVAYGMEPDEAPATKEGEPQQETIEDCLLYTSCRFLVGYPWPNLGPEPGLLHLVVLAGSPPLSTGAWGATLESMRKI